jgi:uncharacterized protein YrzB (UPF0473 family)
MVMGKYIVLNIDGNTSEETQDLINLYDEQGWEVVCDSLSGLILRKKVTDVIFLPLQDEKINVTSSLS